ncbi:MAG: M56 family metallopeptidase [Eubacterium sp.]|nr:M56 family metallopeptidase [Eubacterium sp.]
MAGFLAWLIESSFLVLMIFGIRKVFMGKISYAGIYALWLVVLLRFMVPVNFFQAPVSVANLVEEQFAAHEERLPERQVRQTEVNTGERVQGYKEYGNVPVNFSVGAAARSKMLPAPAQDQGLIQQAEEQAEKTDKKTDWISIAKKIWISVSVAFFLWILISNLYLMRKIRKNRILCGQRESVKIYATDVVSGPCLYGFFRPAIYIPVHLLPSCQGKTAKRDEWDQMITHELVHYQHRDHIWAMLRMILVSVYWFDPFLWAAVSASRKDAELFCDETAVRILGEEKRFLYGEMLVRLAGDHSWGDFRYSMMSMSRRGREMEKRIRAISTKHHYSKWVILPLAVLLLAAVSITGSAGYGPLAKEKNQTETEDGEGTVTGPAVDTGEKNTMTPGDVPVKIPQWLRGGTDVFQMVSRNTGAETPEEAFGNYLLTFTDAVNTGSTEKLENVLARGSKVSAQQCALVRNYYKRGIREEIRAYSVSGRRTVAEDTVEISSREEIHVSYADGTSKLVKQKYRYTCCYAGTSWIIADMKEVQTV